MIGNRFLRLWALVLSLVVPLSATATEVGRFKIDHPALGTAGGSSLHSAIEGLWTRVSDNLGSRYFEYTSKANSSVTTIEHNFGQLIDDLRVTLYSGTGATKSRIVDPALAGWTIAGTSGFTKTKIDVTAPSSGGPHSFTVVIQDSGGRVGQTDFNELAAAPATPNSGTVSLYAKSDKKLYTKDSAGTETQVGASGSGELNLVANPSDANNWSKTGSTGLGANSPTTTTTTGDLPLGGVIGTAIKMTSGTSIGAESAHYTSYSFTTPASLAAKLKVEFWMRPGSNFISNEWTVSVYQGSTRQSLTTDSSSVTYLPNQSGKFTTYFDAAASTTYTLRFARPVNAGSNAGVLNVAGVVVGPGIQPQGAIVTEWQTDTPTITASGGGTVSVGSNGSAFAGRKWRRVGNVMEIVFTWRFGTTSPSFGISGFYSFPLPTGYTVDTSSLPTTSGVDPVLGNGHLYDQDASDYFPLDIYYSSSSIKAAITTSLSAQDLGVTAPVTLAAGDGIFISYKVPIAEWAGSGTVNVGQNSVEYAWNSSTTTTDDTTSFGYGPSGVALKAFAPSGTSYITKRVRFPTPIQETDTVTLEVWDAYRWTPLTQRLGGFTTNDAGTTYYGVRLAGVSSSATDVDVTWFSSWSVGDSWSTLASANYKWRVRKASGGQAVGFGFADISSSGLVSTTTQEFAGEKRLQVNTSGNCGTSGNVCSGTWTPAVQSQTNMDVTTGFANATFSRVGSQVNFSFAASYDPTTANTSASVAISGLPFVTSNFANAYAVKGTCVSNPANNIKPTVFFLQSVSGAQRLALFTTYVENTASQDLYCIGQYTVQ